MLINRHYKLFQYVALGRTATSLSELLPPRNSAESIDVSSLGSDFYYWASVREVFFPCKFIFGSNKCNEIMLMSLLDEETFLKS